jgi:K+-sensing histidine kinase KdpD
MDVKDRIKELGEETKIFIDVIHHPLEIEKRYRTLILSAQQQIILFLPTITAFKREEKIGIFESLKRAADRGVDIRILVPTDEQIEQKIHQKIKTAKNFEIRKMSATTIPVEARTKILIVDKKEYLVMELKDDSKDTFIEAIGSAIFSNSRSTVLSYLTMFDSLCRQTELYEKLEAHDKMQKEFINIASHELRTPIVPILGLSELLYSKGKGEQQVQKQALQLLGQEETLEMLEIIIRNANRLLRLTEDILDVTKIESETLKLRKERFNLNDVILDVVTDYEEQIANDDKKIKLISQCKDIMVVEADMQRITQVISNILSNAIKFTKEGIITVTAETKDSKKEVVIAVRDTGSGIDPEILPKLFTKFVTKSYHGTGLGLYISKSIIEAHGGTMWAENNNFNEKGSTFYFTLPIYQNKPGKGKEVN